MSPKIHVLVHIDHDSAKIQVQARGAVTAKNIQALYVIARRANSFLPRLSLILDVSHARVADDALDELHTCSQAGRLPTRIDPLQSECRISVLEPAVPQLLAA